MLQGPIVWELDISEKYDTRRITCMLSTDPYCDVERLSRLQNSERGANRIAILCICQNFERYYALTSVENC